VAHSVKLKRHTAPNNPAALCEACGIGKTPRVAQRRTAGELLRAALEEKGLGARTFARLLAEEAGHGDVEKERRGVTRRLRGEFFHEDTAERYTRVLGKPRDYFKVSPPPPSRRELERLRSEIEAIREKLDRKLDELAQAGES
jgi:hypothetical protein